MHVNGFHCTFYSWMNVILEFIASLTVFATASFLIIGKENGIAPGVVGLAISYALQVRVSTLIY